MRNKPLFSVLMANFNNGKYIEEAIDSICKQTYTNWEIVIVDDCSTDNSLEILEKYRSNARFKIITNEENLGCGGAKRRAVEEASGELAGFLDPDDILYAKALEIMVKKHLKYPKASLIYSTAYFCDEELHPTEKLSWVGPIPDGKSNLHVSKAGPFASFKVANYRETEGIDPHLLRAVDQDLYYRLEEVGDTVYIDQPLYLYRVHEGGISTLNNVIKAKRWGFYAKKEAYLRRLHNDTLAPNISLWRLFWDYRHMQYKAIRFAILHGKWNRIWPHVRKFFLTPPSKLLEYPLPE